MVRISALLAMLNVRGDGRRLSAQQQRQEEGHRILSEFAHLAPEALLQRLNSDYAGLDSAQVAERMEEVGPNVIGRDQPPGLFRVIIKRVANPLNLLLLLLAAVSIFVDDAVGAGIMTAMVAISVLLAHVQERRSDRAVESLRDMVSNTATVRRRDVPGGRTEIPIEEIVPGDVIHISAGDMLPADVRLMAAKDLFVVPVSTSRDALLKTAGPPVAAARKRYTFACWNASPAVLFKPVVSVTSTTSPALRSFVGSKLRVVLLAPL